MVTEDLEFTRMNHDLNSTIDHVLVNRSAQLHMSIVEAEKFLPGNSSTFATWRQTFSDHFPISFRLRIASSDDDVDF